MLSVMPPWLMPALLAGSSVALVIYLVGVMPTLFMGRGDRKRIKALEAGAKEAVRRHDQIERRIDDLERLLAAGGSHKHGELGDVLGRELFS